MSTKQADNIHMALGMVTEAGELADIFKKNLAYKKPIDWINAREEVGDIMWYLVNFCSMNGFDLEEILERNIAKLKARYPEKFTEENAQSYREFGAEYVSYKNRYHPFVWFIINVVVRIKYKMLVL